MARSLAARLAVAVVMAQNLFTTASAQNEPLTAAVTLSPTVSTTTAYSDLSVSATAASASATASKRPQVHLIKAGSGGFKFDPPSISNVSVGDIITFEFYPLDHSVARAEFGSACVPYEYTGKNKVGFWSTTQWVNTTADITHWNLTINSTEPIFYYCAAPKSCKERYMVGVINPNSTQTLDKQIQSAMSADYQLAPGDPIPAEASSTLVNAPTASASVSATSSHGPASSPASHKLSGGAIAGIVVGGVVFLAICAALFFFVGRSKTLTEVIKNQETSNNMNNNNNKLTPDPHQSMSTYGNGGLGSPYPTSAGFPSPTPYSPQSEGFGNLNNPPQYGQHYATDQHPSGWGSPPQQHMSYISDDARMSHHQPVEMKYATTGVQPALAELHSPEPGQEEYRGELEAPEAPKRV